MESKDDTEKEDIFFWLLSISKENYKIYYLPNTCIREFPVSATKTFP
jgi:hypothetical protein